MHIEPAGPEQVITPPDEGDAAAELSRLRQRNRRAFRIRMAIVGAIVLTVAIVQFHRQAAIWAISHWNSIRDPGPTVDVDTGIQRIYGDGAIVVDIRSEAEFAVSRLVGAQSVPFAELQRKGSIDGLSGERTVIVYDLLGYRSGEAASILQARGIPAFSLRGGLIALVGRGEPIEDDAGITWRVHTAETSHGWLLPPAYQPVDGREK